MLLVAVSCSLVRIRTLPAVTLPPRVSPPSLSEYSGAPLGVAVDLLFMHHAVGARLLADPGVGIGRHPDGGGARRLLEDNGYRVHSATFGSRFGEHNYTFDWLPKFEHHMTELTEISDQDVTLPQGRRNRVILFKSCFENSLFVGEGVEPGTANGPELTLANAKASFRALRSVLEREPNTLFVFLTTPPMALPTPEPLPKILVKRLLGKKTQDELLLESSVLARKFHDWIVAQDGWLVGAPKNLAVFDSYDVLTKSGSSVFLQYPSGDGTDNHPNSVANALLAQQLPPFINRAVRRAQIPLD